MANLFCFIIGTVLGSFWGLLIDRFPHDSILLPRSHCDNCHQLLAYRDLIPILSQILSHSKCRHCQVRIPYWYAGLELLWGCLLLIGWSGYVDLPVFLFYLASVGLIGFDLKSHAFPLIIWLVFFIALFLTTPFNLLVFSCLILACLTELYSLKIGSGDWLYLALMSFSVDFYHLTLCVLLASVIGIASYLFKCQEKTAEVPFLPFLFLGYLLTLLLAPFI
ncbi:MAG: prepilin peptidase [Streptococcaceae bacterium]|jgi:leader peptidase (prepilin peptidase)/N-methyltransferase|nr:prepilin peptidase [Streptococcaceae bacterium]